MSARSWDRYAPYYDWENHLTIGRRDVAFWRDLVLREESSALELGCGTGRLVVPIARAGGDITGVDFSQQMLNRARVRIARLPRRRRPVVVRGDIRALPFGDGRFGTVLAPYGVLQSLLSDRDVDRAVVEAARVLRPGGRLGIDLVPDLERWQPYTGRVSLKGRLNAKTSITLIETVRQDRRRGLTSFDEEFIERRGRRVSTRRFSLSFRTMPMPVLCRRVERAGFIVDALLGDYRGRPWDERADVWIMLATKRRSS